MIPIVTPNEMRAIDAAAPEPPEVLIGRAGAAVARAAVEMLGGSYGRRVAVIAGRGNNGNDGRVAAAILRRRGVYVVELDPNDPPWRLAPVDLVIDAAYGTGFHGTWTPPDVAGAPVLAVDIPSGVDALTGALEGAALGAQRTITFAALKPGLLFEPGARLAGQVSVADIGLAVGAPLAHLVEESDVRRWWPERAVDAHKWRAALRVIAGSQPMTGAARLVAGAAMRAGCGIVHLSVPGVVSPMMPTEVVQRALPATGWGRGALEGLERFGAVALGPGLGRGDDTAAQARAVIAATPLPMIIDGDGLFALGWSGEGAAATLRRRGAPTVLTPHDGEYALLAGRKVGVDRLAAARELAAETGCVVLLKGPATVVAHPDGDVLVTNTGDERLATAGTGDVLTGIIGSLLARGVGAWHAAAAGAWIHGAAARRCAPHGMVAGDLIDALEAAVTDVVDGPR